MSVGSMCTCPQITVADLGAHHDAAAALLQVGPNWTRPVLPKDPKDEQLQVQGFKRVGGKVTPGRAVSGAMEDELAGKICSHVNVDTMSPQAWTGEGGGGGCPFPTNNLLTVMLNTSHNFRISDPLRALLATYNMLLTLLPKQPSVVQVFDTLTNPSSSCHGFYTCSGQLLFCGARIQINIMCCLDDLKVLHVGVKPSADASAAPAQPLGEDTVQTATDQEAAGADTTTGRQVGDASVDEKKPHEGPNVTEPGKAADQGMSEAGDAAVGVALTGDQPVQLDSATTNAVPSSTVAAAESAGNLPVEAPSDPEAGIEKQQAVSATVDEAAGDQIVPAGAQSGAVTESAKSEAVSGVAETKAEGGAASRDAVLAESQVQQDIAVPMDQDRT